MTKRFTSSCILSASVFGFRSCQSGRRAAMNSCQSISPSPFRSKRSATAPISSLDVSNFVPMMPSMNTSRGIRPLLSLSILRNRSVKRDFLWFMNFRNRLRHSSQLN
uniref:Putative secreted protein n=1 Tax=Anopheles triannulatus TaxID=58253 RepID=A0A2M4B0R4_9DIPT